jgi:hypothetical protein
MNAAHLADIREEIDGKTCRSICDAVGERLQRDFRPESSELSPRLQQLMDELRRHDTQPEKFR